MAVLSRSGLPGTWEAVSEPAWLSAVTAVRPPAEPGVPVAHSCRHWGLLVSPVGHSGGFHCASSDAPSWAALWERLWACVLTVPLATWCSSPGLGERSPRDRVLARLVFPGFLLLLFPASSPGLGARRALGSSGWWPPWSSRALYGSGDEAVGGRVTFSTRTVKTCDHSRVLLLLLVGEAPAPCHWVSQVSG